MHRIRGIVKEYVYTPYSQNILKGKRLFTVFAYCLGIRLYTVYAKLANVYAPFRYPEPRHS